MKEITLVMRFVVIGFIYIILFRLIRIMLKDMKSTINTRSDQDFALEVTEAPDLSGIAEGTVFPLTDKITIGRGNDNIIVINDPFVSTKHSEVSMINNKYYIKDTGSTNGTLLNNKPIEDQIELLDGDIIEIGRIKFRVLS